MANSESPRDIVSCVGTIVKLPAGQSALWSALASDSVADGSEMLSATILAALNEESYTTPIEPTKAKLDTLTSVSVRRDWGC